MKDISAIERIKQKPKPDGITIKDNVENLPTKVAMAIAIVFVLKNPAWKDVKENEEKP